jgi:hypothetical protein
MRVPSLWNTLEHAEHACMVWCNCIIIIIAANYQKKRAKK